MVLQTWAILPDTQGMLFKSPKEKQEIIIDLSAGIRIQKNSCYDRYYLLVVMLCDRIGDCSELE